MKKIADVAVALGVVSILVGAFSRITLLPVGHLESRVYAGFAALLFLLAIALNTRK